MTIEALTLARSCLETSFYLAAAVADPAFVDALTGDDLAHKKKTADRATGKHASSTGLLPDQAIRLEAFKQAVVASGARAVPLKMRAVAGFPNWLSSMRRFTATGPIEQLIQARSRFVGTLRAMLSAACPSSYAMAPTWKPPMLGLPSSA
jgi:hypothetical protein